MKVRLPADFDKRPLTEQLTLFAGQVKPDTPVNEQFFTMLTEAAEELRFLAGLPVSYDAKTFSAG